MLARYKWSNVVHTFRDNNSNTFDIENLYSSENCYDFIAYMHDSETVLLPAI